MTGASRGIGKGIARVFARAGAKVLIVARDGKQAEATAEEITAAGGDATPFTADVTRAEHMREAARTAATALLARRDFACPELRQRLMQQGFDEATVADVIAGLAREAVLDDDRYTMNYVAYHAGRGQGPLRIAAELRRRGAPTVANAGCGTSLAISSG